MTTETHKPTFAEKLRAIHAELGLVEPPAVVRALDRLHALELQEGRQAILPYAERILKVLGDLCGAEIPDEE